MQVINLGQFGQQRESDISGLSDAIGKGLQLGVQSREVKAKEDMIKQTMQQNAIENKRAQDKLSLETAQQTFEKEMKGKEYSKKMVEDLSLKLNTMDPTMRSIFEASPEYKQIAKVVKSYAPEFIGEDGKVINFPTEKLIDNKMKQTASVIGEKIAGGQAVTPGEQQFWDDYNKIGSEALAQVYKAAQEDDRWGDADINTKKGIVAQYRNRVFSDPRYVANRTAPNQITDSLGKPVDKNDSLGYYASKAARGN